MKKHIAILDPFPRTLKLIFSKDKFETLKLNYNLIYAPKKNKKNVYDKNIQKTSFIIGQPDLPKELLIKAKKLKAIINVESIYRYVPCTFSRRGRHVLPILVRAERNFSQLIT